jgi:hypothetical protein
MRRHDRPREADAHERMCDAETARNNQFYFLALTPEESAWMRSQ